MGLVQSILGAVLHPLLVSHSIWAVKLTDGRFLSERDLVRDPRYDHDPRWRGGKRPFDWSLDLVATGDILKIKELWLLCPPNKISPLGNTARLPIKEPGTAFQFKVANVDASSAGRSVVSQVIGRVDNKLTGDCTYFVWDGQLCCMSTPMKSNINHFGSWRPGIAKIGRLALDVQGFKLG